MTPDIELIVTAFGLIADYLSISEHAGLAQSTSTAAADRAAEQATQYHRAEEGFLRMAGGGDLALETLSAMQQESQHTIDDATLMQMANKAMLLGLTWDPGELARLLEVARVQAGFLGEDVVAVWNDIITGIYTQDSGLLAKHGLGVDLPQAYQALANMSPEAKGDVSLLTDAGKRLAALQAVMAGTTLGTTTIDWFAESEASAATALERLQAGEANIQAAKGHEILYGREGSKVRADWEDQAAQQFLDLSHYRIEWLAGNVPSDYAKLRETGDSINRYRDSEDTVAAARLVRRIIEIFLDSLTELLQYPEMFFWNEQLRSDSGAVSGPGETWIGPMPKRTERGPLFLPDTIETETHDTMLRDLNWGPMTEADHALWSALGDAAGTCVAEAVERSITPEFVQGIIDRRLAQVPGIHRCPFQGGVRSDLSSRGAQP